MANEATTAAVKPALLLASNLSKQYVQRRGWSLGKVLVNALNHIDFEIPAGCVTALVGESGCGKSTLATCLAMMGEPDSGEIWFEGREISRLTRRQLLPLRSKIQMVFQDSAEALNPRFTSLEIIEEPLKVRHLESGSGLRRRAYEVMQEVGLSVDLGNRRPLQLSGGQRQRLAIARAIALRPKLLILDESLSGLDLSTQAQVLNLLTDLSQAHDLTYLFISHDLAMVGQVADFVAVMHRGEIIERGTTQQVMTSPLHDQTKKLLAPLQQSETAFAMASVGGLR